MAERQSHGSAQQSAQRISTGQERAPMEPLQVPRPAWMTEDLVLLEEQASRFLAAELVPQVEKWTADGIMERSAWDRLGQAGLLCAGMPEEYGGGGGSVAHRAGVKPGLS